MYVYVYIYIYVYVYIYMFKVICSLGISLVWACLSLLKINVLHVPV